MLSFFPDFFDYSAVAVTVLRIVVALIFITEGYKILSQKDAADDRQSNTIKKILIVSESVLGVLLFVGLFTQIVAAALALVSIKKAYVARKNTEQKNVNLPFYILLFFVSLSFLFFGPGLLSIDYPL